MQINPTDAVLATAAQVSGAVNVRVLAGNLTAIPLGTLLQASVTQLNPRDATATLDVNGQPLTIRAPAGLEAGTILFLRVPKSSNGTLEIVDPPRPAKVAQQATAPSEPGQVKVVDVTATLPDGRVRVRIDGQEQIATPSEPLAPGGRFVLEVSRAPSGIVLRPPPESAALPADVATAILRAAPAPDLAATLKPLRDELNTLISAQPAKGEAPIPPPVRDAATTVRATLQALVPNEPCTLDAPALQKLVENGGIHFEAKLARLVDPAPVSVAPAPAGEEPKGESIPIKDAGSTARVPVSVTNGTALKAAVAVAGDLKIATTEQVPAEARVPLAEALKGVLASAQADPTGQAPRLAAIATELKDAFKNVADLVNPDANRAPVAPTPKGDPQPLSQPARESNNSAPTAPDTSRAPNASALKADAPRLGQPAHEPTSTAPTATSDASRAPATTALRGDLKGDLLRLLQTAQELGVATQVPAARAALAGIESQQATQTLAQTTNTPYMLQIPFPDGGAWRTLHLSVDREVPPNQVDPDRAGRFRMLMHVPLTGLGDTWIDAGLSGGSFRASIYLDRADARARVSAALPELRTELKADGFDEVLLDVRPAEALPASAKRQSAAMSAGRPASASLLDVRV